MPIDRRSLLASFAAALGLSVLPGDVSAARFETGTVNWYNRLRGLGFVTLDRPTRTDVLIRRKMLAASGIEKLPPDTRVKVIFDQNFEATHLVVVDAI